MRTGRYNEALEEAERRAREETRSVEVLTLLATARAANAPANSSAESSAEALLQAVAISSRGEAAQAFADEVAGSMAFEADRFTQAAQAMMTLAQAWDGGRDDTDAQHGGAALLTLAAYGAVHQGALEALTPLVRTGVVLLENSTNDLVFPDHDMHTAWLCFLAAGSIAAATSRDSNLSSVTAELAIRIAESNPALAIPVACDLSSPRNGLREVLRHRHDADSLRRLAETMETAEGCSLGTFAP